MAGVPVLIGWTPFLEGLLAGSDPVAEGRMEMHIAILPDADRGMPRWGTPHLLSTLLKAGL